MDLDSIKQIAVINAGPIGSQIAQLLAQVGGYPVILMDVEDRLVDSGIESIREGLKRFFVDKGRMKQEEMHGIVNRITGTTDIHEAVKSADFVIESAEENLNSKRDIFKQLDETSPTDTILASNTIFLDMTAIANATSKPEKVVGMHFFEPTLVMKLIEVVRGANTSDETTDMTVALAEKLGKEVITCKGFSYGHLANRAYFGMLAEAVQMLWERVGTPEDIDKC